METKPRGSYAASKKKAEAIKLIAEINNEAVEKMQRACKELGVSYFGCRQIMAGTIKYEDGLVNTINFHDYHAGKEYLITPGEKTIEKNKKRNYIPKSKR